MIFDFGPDWFSRHIPVWQHLGGQLGWRGETPLVAVEVGSYEGRSACWMLQHWLRHPDSRLYCIDSFVGTPRGGVVDAPSLQARLVANLEATGQGRQVEVFAMPSDLGLRELWLRGVQADVVYLDGSHTAADTLSDAVLAFKLLRAGGLMIFDDYLWREHTDLLLCPKPGIDAFTTVFGRQLLWPHLPSNSQFYAIKSAAAPLPPLMPVPPANP